MALNGHNRLAVKKMGIKNTGSHIRGRAIGMLLDNGACVANALATAKMRPG